MTSQDSTPPKSKKGLIIGIAVGVVLLLLIFIAAVIGAIGYWHWATKVNS